MKLIKFLTACMLYLAALGVLYVLFSPLAHAEIVLRSVKWENGRLTVINLHNTSDMCPNGPDAVMASGPFDGVHTRDPDQVRVGCWTIHSGDHDITITWSNPTEVEQLPVSDFMSSPSE